MLITTQTELNEFCASLTSCEFITADTEFLREKTYYPKLCLIQLGAPDGRAAAIDPLIDGIDLTPVLDLLFDPNIIKIFHAARQDLEIFYNMTGKVVAPLFDSQIAAMVCGYGEQIGYDNLVGQITGSSMDKSSQYTNWSNRPLTQKQIDYALGDVTHLVDVYRHLSAELEKRDRTEWVTEEKAILEAPSTYALDPQEMWKKVKIKSPKPKTLAILQGLAAWREQRAQDKNIPRNWILRDETLADMAAQAPKDTKGLKKIRNMSSDQAEGRTGKALLAVIEGALKTDPATWPQVKRNKQLPPSISATVEILKMLLKLKAAEHQVAPKLIANSDDLEAIAKLGITDDTADDIAPLRGWRKKVFGDAALALKSGDIAIGLKDGKINIVSLGAGP